MEVKIRIAKIRVSGLPRTIAEIWLYGLEKPIMLTEIMF